MRAVSLGTQRRGLRVSKVEPETIRSRESRIHPRRKARPCVRTLPHFEEHRSCGTFVDHDEGPESHLSWSVEVMHQLPPGQAPGTSGYQLRSMSQQRRSESCKQELRSSRTRYALTGTHVQVKCQSCHLPQPDGTPKYVGIRFDNCSACHKDVHQGEFKQTCQSCHNTGGWKRTTFIREFDHSKTKFTLVGKHLEVACDTAIKAGISRLR